MTDELEKAESALQAATADCYDAYRAELDVYTFGCDIKPNPEIEAAKSKYWSAFQKKISAKVAAHKETKE